MSGLAIEAKNLSKKYSIGRAKARSFRDLISQRMSSLLRKEKDMLPVEFWALKDVSFQINQGDIVGVIGKNGAGKSTLLKIISNITQPTTGQVDLYGRVASLLEVGTGFHPELTGRENIYLNGTILGMSRNEVSAKFEEIVEFSGVAKFIDTPVKRYSSGMTVRLAFAVAAHLEPEILIVDEVLAVGDAEFQKKCLGKMDEVSKKEGRTILFVSHNVSVISTLCKKGMFLHEGRLTYSGGIAEAISLYQSGIDTTLSSNLLSIEKREGNGYFRFSSIRFENENETEPATISSGANVSLIVELVCDTFSTINDFQLDIGINDMAGSPLAWLSTYYSGNSIKIKHGFNRLKIDLNEIPLVPGTYRITLYGKLNGDVADWIVDCFSFSVETGDFYKTGWFSKSVHGNILVKHSISLLDS